MSMKALLHANTHKPLRVMYAAGPGDIVMAHRSWMAGQQASKEVSITFSSQIADAFLGTDCILYMQSDYYRKDILLDRNWVIENRPLSSISAHGAIFHLILLWKTARIVATALHFHADVLFIDSGRAEWFGLSPLKWFGISVIPILHNNMWPAGHKSTRIMKLLVYRLNGRYWRSTPTATIAFSPECERQVLEIAGHTNGPIIQARAQFLASYFDAIPAPPDRTGQPFQVMYAGRIEKDKGALDLAQMAQRLEKLQPGHFAWTICGDGSALAELSALIKEYRLEGSVILKGRQNREQMAEAYSQAQAIVVPTKSSFAEGFAMVVAEAVLAGRPCVTSSVVPALEILEDACVRAVTDDVDSYVAALLALASDRKLYKKKAEACAALRQQFVDRSFGLTAAIKLVFSQCGLQSRLHAQ